MDIKINLPSPRKKGGYKRKVLRIRTGEFLLAIYPDRMETTANIKYALDLNGVPFEVINDITHNLYNLGYRELQVIEVK